MIVGRKSEKAYRGMTMLERSRIRIYIVTPKASLPDVYDSLQPRFRVFQGFPNKALFKMLWLPGIIALQGLYQVGPLIRGQEFRSGRVLRQIAINEVLRTV